MNPFEMVAMLGTLGISAFTIVKIATLIVNRRHGAVPAAQLQSVDEKLTRIEQGMEAMAIEVERISEGQRFTTRLLSEKSTKNPAS